MSTPPRLPVSSSLPPPFPEEQQAAFRGSLEALNGCGVPYVVAGAFALHFHTGIWRTTKDMDLFLAAEQMPGAMQCLCRKGFACEVCDPVWLSKAHRNGFFVDLITGMSNGVIMVDDSWVRRARPASVFGVETRVLAAEELLTSKLFVLRRERFDGADVAHIVYASRGRLDWNRILLLVGDHWELLLGALVLFRYVYPACGHHVPSWLWRDLWERHSRELAHPDPGARFRGSLIDENMFAIDMQEWGMDDVRVQHRSRLQDRG